MSAPARHASSAKLRPTTVPSYPRLVRTELHRLFARRFFRVLLLVGVLAYLAALSTVWAQHKRPDAADRAQATVQRDQQLAEQQKLYKQCLAQAPQGQADQQCPPLPTAADFSIDNFYHNHPLQPTDLRGIAAAIGAGTALLGFILGASFIGAEWSSKNLIAWLFWEPRRLRLLGAKLLAPLAMMLMLSAIAQLAFVPISRIMLHQRGVPVSTLAPPDRHFWLGLAEVQLRAGLLVVATVLLGFGLANLIRNTAAAFAVSFVYFAVIESVLRALDHNLIQYLFTTNLAAWVSRHGITIVTGQKFDPKQNFYTDITVHLSNLHGGLTLLVYAGVVTVLSVWLFRRRDIA